MSPCALLVIAAIQLVTLLAPLALGLTGLVSGATAGLTSVVAWFLLGMPFSYAVVDGQAARRARREPRRQHGPMGPLDRPIVAAAATSRPDL